MVKRYCPTASGMDAGMSMVLDSELDELEVENAKLREALKQLDDELETNNVYCDTNELHSIIKAALESEE